MHKFLTKRMNVLTLAILLTALVLIGILVIKRQNSDLELLERTAEAQRQKELDAMQERSELENELAISNTDDYIAEKARTLYGFLYEDEIRFIITNPEVLYGDEDIDTAQAEEVLQ